MTLDDFTKVLLDISPKDWLLFCLGFLIPILTQAFTLGYRFVKHFSELKDIVGTWHTYHFSRENDNPVFRHEVWKIRRGFLKRAYLTTSDPSCRHLRYRGRVVFDRGDIILEASRNGEIWHTRFTPPIAGRNPMIKGFLLGQDFNRITFATVKIGFRQEVRDSDAKQQLKDILLFDQEDHSLRLATNAHTRKAPPSSRLQQQ